MFVPDTPQGPALYYVHLDRDTVTAFHNTMDVDEVRSTIEVLSPINRAVLVAFAKLIVESQEDRS